MNDGIIIIHLLMYLQNMIDSGQHKVFYNDLMHDEKVIDIINAITNLQEENENLNTELNTYKNAVYKVRSYINAYSPYFLQTQEENNQTIAKIIHEELDDGDE